MFSGSELADMQAAQENHMMDLCHRMVFSQTTNDYNEQIKVWTESMTDIKCGLEQQSGSEQLNAVDTVTIYDAIIRLPLSEVWDVKDRIKVTKRFGVDTTDLTYEIVAPIQRGPSGIRLLLRKVEV